MSKPILTKVPLKIGLEAAAAGYILGAGVMVAAILRSTSSTAAISFLFVPFYAFAPAALCFVLAFCAAYFLRSWGVPNRRRALATWLALGVAISILATGCGYLLEELHLVRQVQHCLSLDAPALNAYFRDPSASRNKFVLGAIAQNAAANADLLDSISLIEDPELHRKMGSLFPKLGDNSKGLAVMRLVARHPNVNVETLARLSESADDYVLGDVVMNPKTPGVILRQAHEKGGYLIEWGLAYNPKCPTDILSTLAESSNQYTRSAVAKNPGTRLKDVGRLARDPVWHVRRATAYHPEVPHEVLQHLGQDADEQVKRAATAILNRR
jgi:hypothetical protein